MKPLVITGLRAYKRWLSPLLPRACRYLPTCSDYAREAVELHGVVRGGWLATRRLCRCHPWGGHGYDPVPSPPGGQDSAGDQDSVDKGHRAGDQRR